MRHDPASGALVIMLRLDLIILDELGYLPFSSSGGALLFHLLSKLYEQTSIITTNLSFSEWAMCLVPLSVCMQTLAGQWMPR